MRKLGKKSYLVPDWWGIRVVIVRAKSFNQARARVRYSEREKKRGKKCAPISKHTLHLANNSRSKCKTGGSVEWRESFRNLNAVTRLGKWSHDSLYRVIIASHGYRLPVKTHRNPGLIYLNIARCFITCLRCALIVDVHVFHMRKIATILHLN